MLKFRFTSILLALILGANADAALTIEGYNAARHERSSSSLFLGSGFDFSGVANGNGSSFTGWATMISQSYFLSATHFHPNTGATLRFYTSNSLTGAFIDRTVQSGQAIDGSDLWLGKLTQSVTSNIAHYSIATGDPTGSLIDVVGRSTSGTGQRVGANIVDGVIDDFSDPNLGSSVSDVYLFEYNNPGIGADEAYVQGGDSGAPSFSLINGQLAVAGIHWFQYSDNNGNVGSGDTRAGSYVNSLNAAMSGESVSFVPIAVPEPSMLAFISIGFVLLINKRMRKGPPVS